MNIGWIKGHYWINHHCIFVRTMVIQNRWNKPLHIKLTFKILRWVLPFKVLLFIEIKTFLICGFFSRKIYHLIEFPRFTKNYLLYIFRSIAHFYCNVRSRVNLIIPKYIVGLAGLSCGGGFKNMFRYSWAYR